MKFVDEICKGRLFEIFRVYEYVRMANSKATYPKYLLTLTYVD